MPKLMDTLEFLDSNGKTMVKRMPDSGEYEINWGSQLTVRESQTAIFFRDGKALDVFGPGRHVLQTQNIPVLTKLVTRLGYGTKSPFRSEVYFMNMSLFRNLKWGTREPILFKDSELKMIRLRSFGIFSMQIDDPSLFLNKVVGTQGIFTDNELEDYLKNIIVTKITDIFGENIKTIFDLPKDYANLSLVARASIQNDFEGLGLKVHDFFINSVSVPPEVQEMIDSRAGMAAIGDMDQFLKFKAALAMESAAENPGGGAGTGVGVGAGMGMGFMLPQMLAGAMNSNSGQSNNINNPMEKLKKLKELLDLGAISKEEYDSKKVNLMDQF